MYLKEEKPSLFVQILNGLFSLTKFFVTKFFVIWMLWVLLALLSFFAIYGTIILISLLLNSVIL